MNWIKQGKIKKVAKFETLESMGKSFLQDGKILDEQYELFFRYEKVLKPIYEKIINK